MRQVALAAVLIFAGCDRPAPEPAKKGSAPLKEVQAASGSGNSNPAPIVDPTGSVQVYKGAKHEVGCENNLRQIYLCMQVYESTLGHLPDTGNLFEALLNANCLGDLQICVIPRATADRNIVIHGGKGVYLTTRDKLSDSSPRDKPVVWDPEPFGDGRHVLRLSGEIVQLSEDQFHAEILKYEGK